MSGAAAAFRALAARGEASAWTLGAGWFDRAAVAAVALAGVLFVWTSSLRSPEALREAVGVLLRVQMGAAGFLASLSFARGWARDRERGLLDLLLLAPLPGPWLLLARALGRLAGLACTLAAALPAILGCAAPGGMALSELLVSQALVLGVMAAAGGFSAFFGALVRGPAAAAATLLVLGAWLLLPAASPDFDGLCPSGLLERELADVGVDPSRALDGLAQGAAALFVFCVLGGLALRRRHARSAGEGGLARALRSSGEKVRTLERSGRWGKYFRPLLGRPTIRLEALGGRDLAYRLAWLLGIATVSVAGVLAFTGRGRTRFEHDATMAGVYGAVVLGLVALHTALSLSAARRGGRLETLLAANVEPDDLLRSRHRAALKRGAYLGLPAVVYLVIAACFWGLSREEAAGSATAVAGFAGGVLVAATGGLAVAVVFRRATLAAAAAALAIWPASILAAVVIGASVYSVLIAGPLTAALSGVAYAWAVRRFRRWSLT